MIDRRLIANFDWLLLLLMLFAAIEGVLLIYSATFSAGLTHALYIRQIYWLLLGLLAVFVIISIDYHHLGNWAYFFYGLNLLLLVVLLVQSQYYLYILANYRVEP